MNLMELLRLSTQRNWPLALAVSAAFGVIATLGVSLLPALAFDYDLHSLGRLNFATEGGPVPHQVIQYEIDAALCHRYILHREEIATAGIQVLPGSRTSPWPAWPAVDYDCPDWLRTYGNIYIVTDYYGWPFDSARTSSTYTRPAIAFTLLSRTSGIELRTPPIMPMTSWPKQAVLPTDLMPIGLVGNALFYACAWFMAWIAWRSIISMHRLGKGACPACGYDIQTHQCSRCPECGLTLDTLET